MIIDAISGEMYGGTHYVHGGANAWLWGGSEVAILAAAPPDVPGIEFTVPRNLLHFSAQHNRLHYTIPANPLHFAPEEN